MYEIIKQVIVNGGYKLVDIQQKIKRLYVLGDLTTEQMDELLGMASSGANPDSERPEFIESLKSLAHRIDLIESKIASLEGNNESSAGEETLQYPKWEPWDGISNNYQYGAIVNHKDELWVSTYAGQNVWEPGSVGDDIWMKHTEEEA